MDYFGSGSMNFIKPFDIPFLFTLPSLLHINVITGALQTYDTGPKDPSNIDILVRHLSDAGRLKTLRGPIVIGGDNLPSPGSNRVT